MEDKINHPKHYTTGKIEVIDFIEDKQLGFHRGNAVKYVVRAGIKNPETEIEDLEKARWYLAREIDRVRSGISHHRPLVIAVQNPVDLPEIQPGTIRPL